MAKKDNRHAELVSASVNIDTPYELPEGWKWCRLGDVAEIARGGSPRPIEKYITTEEDGINWIKIGDAEKDGKYIFSTREKIIKEGLPKTRYVEEGDFLLTNSMSFGRPYILKTSGCIHYGWLVIKKCTAYNQDFLYYLLSSTSVFRQFALLAKGSTVKNLKSETVRQVILPLPTLTEQQRIVNRIETMFAKLDEAKEKAQTVLDSFETRKAAILHKAFTGELTVNWRKANGVNDESWEEKKIGDCCKLGSGGTPSKSHPEYYENGDIPWLKTGEIDWNDIYDVEEKITKDGVENSSAKIYPAESVVVAMYGMGVTRGKAGILKIPTTTNQAVCVLQPDESLFNRFLFYYFMCNYWTFREKAVGGNQLNYSATMISKWDIELPSIPEQQEIVRILDTVLEKERTAKEAAEQVLEQIDLLKKSLLARAFRGEL